MKIIREILSQLYEPNDVESILNSIGKLNELPRGRDLGVSLE